MKGKRWVVIDTETDGLYEPIHVVELSGQLMDGWDAVGEPFRMLLNHDVPIDPAAEAIHGYSREYLRQHGEKPERVYELFRDYAKDYPLIAHNLSFDWNRCLQPEWARLGLPDIGHRGFCCMMLARRLVRETQSFRLEVLKEQFRITPSQSHRAQNDVLTVVELFQKIYRPRLETAKLDSYDAIAAFAKQTPVAKCRDIIFRGVTPTPVKQASLKDEWYYLDAATNPHGPHSAWQINQASGLEIFYVWREGMADWTTNKDCQEFLFFSQKPPLTKQASKICDGTKSMPELIGLCRGIIADKKITAAEVLFLNSWLEDVAFIAEWPAPEIAQAMERILEDGVITKEEKQELKQLLEQITDGFSAAKIEAPRQAVQVSEAAKPTQSSIFPYTIVHLNQGTHEWLKWRHLGIGASDAPVIMGENPWKDISELLRDKRGAVKKQFENETMARGTKLEPEARKRYVQRRGVDVQPACLQSTQYDWLRASVDGLSVDGKSVVEIKCGNSVYRRTAESGQVPDYYYGQLQHALAVTGLAVIDFWCYLPDCPELLVIVERNDDYIKRLLEAEYLFWQKVLSPTS
jgi:putative phage-type endonuclease